MYLVSKLYMVKTSTSDILLQGEQYAVQKILSHYASDLRAVFLHYAQVIKIQSVLVLLC
jgi:hypothetical protein